MASGPTPPGPGPGPGPGPAVEDREAPRLSKLKLSRRGGRATLRLALSEAARVTVRLERATRGRRKGRRCVAGRGGRRCTRYVKARTVRRAVEAGTRRIALGRRLERGAYRVTVTAADAAGNRSAKRTLKLRV